MSPIDETGGGGASSSSGQTGAAPSASTTTSVRMVRMATPPETRSLEIFDLHRLRVRRQRIPLESGDDRSGE